LINADDWWSIELSIWFFVSVVLLPKWKRRTNDDHHDFVVDSFIILGLSLLVIGFDSTWSSFDILSTSIGVTVWDSSISSGIVFSCVTD
jgi:hypothetical protein